MFRLKKQTFRMKTSCLTDRNQLFQAKKSTKETALKLFRQFGFDLAFARADIMALAGITSTPAGELIKKLKEAKLIEAVSGQGKGKYKFIMPKE